jgi:hypothetical protein
VDFMNGATNSFLAFDVYPMCQEPNIATGINSPTFTNDTTVDLLSKTNPFGFYLEKSLNQLNG